MFTKDTSGARLLDELARDDSDIEIVKKRYSIIYGTGLESLLQELNTDPQILAGVNSHACIRTSSIDAYQRDFQELIVRDCVASKDLEHNEITLDYLDRGLPTVTTLM